MISGRRRDGYTLLEVLLVMAILVILVAVSIPSLDAMYGDTRVRGAADDVRGAWAEARARAIDTGVGHRFAVIPGSERYRVAPDSHDYWDGSKETEADGDDGKVLTGSLPSGIVFDIKQDLPEEAGGWRVIATFLPDGTCRDDARVVVQPSDGGSPLIVSVRGLTGIVTVRTPKQEEGR